MKIHGNSAQDMHGSAVSLAAKARGAAAAKKERAAAAPAAAEPIAAAPSPSAPSSAVTPAPVESTVSLAARKLPPGLVRVAARFEAMGAEGRTAGQSNAYAQITRNLQRYAEAQGLATPPAPSTPAPAVPLPEADPVVAETVPPVATPLDVEAAVTDAPADAAEAALAVT